HYVAAAFSCSAFQQRLLIQVAAYQGNAYAIEDDGTLWSKLAAFTFFAFTGSSPGNTDAGYFDKFFYAFLRLIWAQQNHIPASVCLIEWHRGLLGTEKNAAHKCDSSPKQHASTQSARQAETGYI